HRPRHRDAIPRRALRELSGPEVPLLSPDPEAGRRGPSWTQDRTGVPRISRGDEMMDDGVTRGGSAAPANGAAPAGGAPVKETVRAFIERATPAAELEDDLDLFETGLVNSLFAVQLVTFIEKTFAIEVGMDDLDM